MESLPQQNPWNTLEIVKLLASILTPLVLLALGFFGNRILNRLQQKREALDKVTVKRLQIYDDVGFKVNDIYSYFRYVGKWKEYTPDDIIIKKRDLDTIMYTYRPLFTEEFFSSYKGFLNATFFTFGGWGTDAKLRTSWDHRAEKGKAKWKDHFSGENNMKEIHLRYENFLQILARELGLEPTLPRKT